MKKKLNSRKLTKKQNNIFPSKVKTSQKGSYTIYIATFSSISNVQDFVKKYFSDFEKTKVFKIKGTSYFKVISGEFVSKTEARKSLKRVSNFLVRSNDISVEKIAKYQKYLSS